MFQLTEYKKHTFTKLVSFTNSTFIFFLFFNFLNLFIYFFVFLLFLWAAPAAYGGSQARGLIGAANPGLRQSHSNVASEPRLQPTA